MPCISYCVNITGVCLFVICIGIAVLPCAYYCYLNIWCMCVSQNNPNYFANKKTQFLRDNKIKFQLLSKIIEYLSITTFIRAEPDTERVRQRQRNLLFNPLNSIFKKLVLYGTVR